MTLSPLTGASYIMPDHFYKKFPNHIEGIKALLQKDATFREICADYEEICTWLDSQDCSKDSPSKESDLTRELMWELEAEITKVLWSARL